MRSERDIFILNKYARSPSEMSGETLLKSNHFTSYNLERGRSCAVEINPNILALKESATLKINQQVLNDRKKGKRIMHFGFGQSPFPVPRLLQNELKKHTHEKDYLPTRGLLPLRENISQYYRDRWGYEFGVNEIVIGPGSKELIFQALFTLQGEVLVPAPSWVSYGPQVQIKGRQIHPLYCDEDNGYKLRASNLSDYCKQLDDRQKILIMNSPNNPTGMVYQDDEIGEIAEVCKRQNIIIISDEIYGEIDFTKKRKKGFFSFCPERTLVTGGLSKTFSAGGWRMGFIATSPHFSPFITALSAMISETYSSVSAPIQHASIVAYSQHPDINERLATCQKIHSCVGKYMAERFRAMGARVSNPQGGFYLLPNFNKFGTSLEKKFGIKTSVDMAHLIYEKIQVAMLPASDFYMPDEFLGLRVSTVDYNGRAVLSASRKAKELNHKFIEKNCPNVALGMDRLSEFFSELS